MAVNRYYSSVAGAPTLTGSINSAVTSCAVTSVSGFPNSTPYTLVIDPGLPSEEIVTVTGVAGTTLAITRGEDGSSAQSHSLGATVRHMATARDLREPQEHIAASENIHGVGSGNAVVGSGTTQTLTNKTMSGASNAFSAIPSSAVTGLDTHTAATAAHGATGAVVGTTNTQTLTNKTISGASNTLSAIPQASVTNLTTDLSTLTTAISTETSNRTAAINTAIPVGSIQMWGGAAAPTNWALCDGTAISRSTYSTLFGVIGTTFGSGNGSTTFNLPNLKGKVPVGLNSAETEFDALAETGGAKTHTLDESEIPSHTHALTSPTFPSGVAVAEAAYSSGSGANRYFLANGIAGLSAAATGGGGAHNNLQPYVVLNFIIRVA